MTVKIPVEETSVYENLIGEKKTDNEPISLLDHMDLEDEEREKFSANNEPFGIEAWIKKHKLREKRFLQFAVPKKY